MLPVCEGIVDYSLKKQSVSYLRRPSEREHVNGPQSWMSLAQTTANRITQKKTSMKITPTRCYHMEDMHYLAAIVATFTIQAMICPPNVFTCLNKKNDAIIK